MDLKLAGKCAFVTGSSRGIGAVIAKTLAGEGAKLIVHGRNEEAARAVADEVGAAGEVAVVLGDLSDPAVADCAIDEAIAAFGGVDILVNNAAASGPSSWDTTNAENWGALYHSNVLPAVRLSARLAPLMKERGWGRLIHIGSSSAAIGLPKAPEYAATKAALAAMSSSLAKHYGEYGVTSNILGVGTINNLGMRKDMPPAEDGGDPLYQMMIGGAGGHYNINPMKRMGTPEEVAFIVAMLASPNASFVNGALVRVDGGKIPNLGL